MHDDLRRHLELAAERYGADLPLRMPAIAELRAPTGPAPERKRGTGGPDPDPNPHPARDPDPDPEPVPGPGPGSVHPPDPQPHPQPVLALAALGEELRDCRRCKLCETRTHVVFGEGNPRPRVLFIGEAPGETEDRLARPFVGRAGELLDKIIENAMGLRRGDVYIANVNKCRPPGNREPAPDEVAACLPFLRRQIEILRPEVIVTLGKVATWNLLGATAPMRVLRGSTQQFAGIPVIPTWHPAYLLRNPAAKSETWADVRRVNRMLGLPEVPAPRRDGQA